MNVNFSVFIDKILSGEKRQTIRRAGPKWQNVKAGDKLTLYTGLSFDDVRDFFTFFWNTYFWGAHLRKRPQFAETKIEMVVIRWKDFKEAKDGQR